MIELNEKASVYAKENVISVYKKHLQKYMQMGIVMDTKIEKK